MMRSSNASSSLMSHRIIVPRLGSFNTFVGCMVPR